MSTQDKETEDPAEIDAANIAKAKQLLRNKTSFNANNDTDIKQILFAESKQSAAVQQQTLQSTKKRYQKDITSILNTKSLYEARLLFNPVSLYKKAYILLDTAVADYNLTDITNKYRWNVLPLTAFSENSNSVYVEKQFSDIVAMRIYPVRTDLSTAIQANFDFTADPSATYTTADPRGVINLNEIPTYNSNVGNKHNAFSILIEELSAQAYIGQDGKRYHFLLFPSLMNPITFETNVEIYNKKYVPMGDPGDPSFPRYELVTSGKGNGWFYFNNPVKYLETITLQISDMARVFFVESNRTLIPIEFTYLTDRDDE
jgi:hypothetical protein